jgi:hypothetical protein
MKSDEFTIIIDTREQQPWGFDQYVTANRKLDTGDYSIEGLEKIFTIERKKSVTEIVNNISEDRFKKELVRMAGYPHKFLLLEFTIQDVLNYPIGSTVPKKMWSQLKITNKYIMKFLSQIPIEYNVHVMFCGNSSSAEEMALSIIKRINEKYGKQSTNQI